MAAVKSIQRADTHDPPPSFLTSYNYRKCQLLLKDQCCWSGSAWQQRMDFSEKTSDCQDPHQMVITPPQRLLADALPWHIPMNIRLHPLVGATGRARMQYSTERLAETSKSSCSLASRFRCNDCVREVEKWPKGAAMTHSDTE